MSITRTTITIQTQQRIVVRHLHESTVSHCDRCLADVPLVAAEYLVNEMQLAPTTLRAMLEQDVLHTVETPSGAQLICCGHPPAIPDGIPTEIREENQDEHSVR